MNSFSPNMQMEFCFFCNLSPFFIVLHSEMLGNHWSFIWASFKYLESAVMTSLNHLFSYPTPSISHPRFYFLIPWTFCYPSFKVFYFLEFFLKCDLQTWILKVVSEKSRTEWKYYLPWFGNYRYGWSLKLIYSTFFTSAIHCWLIFRFKIYLTNILTCSQISHILYQYTYSRALARIIIVSTLHYAVCSSCLLAVGDYKPLISR